MTIGRAQIEEQIKGFNAGGASVANNMTGNMTDEQTVAVFADAPAGFESSIDFFD